MDSQNSRYLSEYGMLYADKLQLLAISKCLETYSDYSKSQHYDENYAQGELIDHRNKRIEGCLDQIYDLHKVFNEEFYK